ncbi:CRTAC1 family protein [Anianabacter salinae]|uniref:CRTAC1 family protein n=1 Tax=Anianabacter salinae TaxID=2851023 RepID=UPI00225DFDDA|nr:CRTAC1 family protein [Anianabacter salinae]MBV0912019.1 CRTAC1 family protein [Anianabacter salinae]
MRALVLILAAAPAAADPQFRPVPLPTDHVYSGGWEHFVGGGLAAFDCDGDAMPELLAAGGEAPMTLLRNVTPSVGGDLAFAAGDFPEITGATGAYPLDIDGDGTLDLFVLRVGANMALKGGPDCAFTDATADWGIDGADRWSTAFSATWEAGQDRPTLAVGNYVDRDDPDGPFQACDGNQLLRPAAQGYDSTPLTPGFCALSMLFSDAARRGVQDLRVSNDRHYYVRGGTEQMWQFPEVRLLGPEDGFDPVSIWGMGIASTDLTGDGLPEVVLTSMGDQLLQFARAPYAYDSAPYETGATAHRPHVGDDGRPSTGWHSAFGDADNDGREDIFIAKGNVDQMPGNAMHDPNSLLMQQADGTFREVSDIAGVASDARGRGAVFDDLNGDGLRDLAVVNRRAPLEVWQNVTTGSGQWIAVEARQAGGNTRAVGGFVALRLPGGTVREKEITVGGGHAGGSALPVHFGLGDVQRAEVRVTWPGGTATDWTPIDAGQSITIRRP